MESFKALTAQYAEKHKQLADFFSANKSEDLTIEQVEQVRAWNIELNELGEKREKAKELEAIQEKTGEIGRELAKPHGRPNYSSRDSRESRLFLSDAFVGALYKDGSSPPVRRRRSRTTGSPSSRPR